MRKVKFEINGAVSFPDFIQGCDILTVAMNEARRRALLKRIVVPSRIPEKVE
jgi:hypothetical protein